MRCPCLEHVRHIERVAVKRVHLVGREELTVPATIAVARAAYAIGQLHRRTSWKVCTRRIDVNELGIEIRVLAIGRAEQMNLNRCHHSHVVVEGLGFQYQHLGPCALGQIRRS